MTDHTSNLIDRRTLIDMGPYDVRMLLETEPHIIGDNDLHYLLTSYCEELDDLDVEDVELNKRDPCDMSLSQLDRREKIRSKRRDLEAVIPDLVEELRSRKQHGTYWYYGTLRTY
jgi:hypothetical protein